MTLYSLCYRWLMQFAHRHNWHHAPPIYPDGDKQLWCKWCGFRMTVARQNYPMSLAHKVLSGLAGGGTVSSPAATVTNPTTELDAARKKE